MENSETAIFALMKSRRSCRDCIYARRRYGLLIRVLPAREDGKVPVRIFGPADAGRDAAALLWALFSQVLPPILKEARVS